MPGWLKFVVWVLILLACAGVGAFVASRSNLFPPEVSAPSPSTSVSSSPSASAEPPVRWRLTLTSRTSHTYRVGGACTSDWRMRVRILEQPDGEISGQGVARLLSGAGCDFPSGQVQAETISVRIRGIRQDGIFELRFRPVEVGPPGAQDLGGFVRTLAARRHTIRARDGATAKRTTTIEDPADEIQLARTTLLLSG
jgi:hypothetical protein